jgi:hypothetical protein
LSTVKVATVLVERRLRVLLAVLGVASLAALGLVGHGSARVPLTGIAFVCLLVAALLVVVEVRRARPGRGAPLERGRPVRGGWSTSSSTRSAGGWKGALVVLGVSALATQTWFVSGTVLAGGDIAPPVGTAWFQRLFEPWVWTGGSLGSPNPYPTQLPWAALDAAVHLLGGDGALAQRLWLSALFVAGALAGYWLLRVLGLRAPAAVAGALVWVFNAYVLTWVGINDVFLAGMILVAGWPAVVLEVARGHWRVRYGLLAFVLSAPLAGYVYSNPPLLGLALAMVVVAVLLAGLLGGRAAARRGALAVAGGLVALVVASAYWLVPSLEVLKTVTGGLRTTVSWGWTERRVSIANGFWLNTAWGWSFKAYYPYAPAYGRLPFSLLKFLVPALAFSALALVEEPSAPVARRRAKLAAAGALVALGLIVLGDGTIPPGSLLFDPLYHLPYGWLLQDPGRFLMAAALGYGVLSAVAVECGGERLTRWVQRQGERVRLCARAAVGRQWQWLPTAVIAVVVPAVAVVSVFPMAGGIFVPGEGKNLPVTHVRVPGYWESLASFVNRDSPTSTIVILPPDDFYQMPYTWYYGNDGFIPDLLAARVVDPTSSGYTPSSEELMESVDQVAGALLSHRWRAASEILRAIGATDVLVRGDIEANLRGRDIVSPARLIAALRIDPLVHLAHRSGPLWLFSLERSSASMPRPGVTVNSSRPDLAVLTDLPAGARLVTGKPVAGIPSVLQPPPTTTWRLVGDRLEHSVDEPAGWRYRVVTLPSLDPNSVSRAGQPTRGAFIVSSRPIADGGHQVELAISVGPTLLRDGDFSKGLWGPVGNCDNFPGFASVADLHAEVIADAGPGGSNALGLSARADRACEAQMLAWRGGPVLVSLFYRTVEGGAASLCVWQVGPGGCSADDPPLSTKPGWHYLQFRVVAEKGTSKLMLFLYATPTALHLLTLDEYADVSVHSLPKIGEPVLIGGPMRSPVSSSVRLELSTQGFFSAWTGPPGSTHVLVDGLRNGWLLSGVLSASDRAPRYRPARAFRTAEETSGVGVALLVLGVLLAPILDRRRRKVRRRRAGPRDGASGGECLRGVAAPAEELVGVGAAPPGEETRVGEE